MRRTGSIAVRFGGLSAGHRNNRRSGAVIAAAFCGFVLNIDALSAEPSPGPNTEIFTGLEATDNAVSGYVGAGYAFGHGLWESGWRVRAVGSLGAYDYRSTLFRGGSELATTFDGTSRYGAALLGYQLRANSLFLKVFAGFEAEDQSISPRDPNNAVQGSAVGAKLVAESWYDFAPLWFASVDASYGTAFQEYWSRARLGYRVGPRLALGIEGGAVGNEEYDAGRGGAFARLGLRGLELTLAGGFSGNYLEDEPSGYVSLASHA
jgi:hypothetical protein